MTIRMSVDADHDVIDIADTGPGIPKDARPHIFDACFTTKEVGRGTGQGLALALALARLPIAGRAAVVSFDDAGASAA